MTMGQHLLLRSPKGSLKHWALLIISIVPGGSVFRKSRKSQPILKISDKKDNPGDLPGMEEALPIALLCTSIAPKEQICLSPYEMLYGRPVVYVNDLFLDPESQTLQSYTTAIGQFQQDICLWGVNQDPKDSKDPPVYAPWIQVLLKSGKMGPQRLSSSTHGRAPTL